MSPVTFRELTGTDDPALAALPALFTAMHAEMAEQGLLLQLAETGAATWAAALPNGLERFHRLSLAERDGAVIGFAQAAVKLAPEHLGGTRIGHIAHVYVVPAERRQGIAAQLAQRVHAWLHERGVHSVELQVVHGNTGALAFWRALGYRTELVQLRKL